LSTALPSQIVPCALAVPMMRLSVRQMTLNTPSSVYSNGPDRRILGYPLGRRTMPRSAHLLHDAKHWQSRAEEMRVVAEDMRDPVNKQAAMRIAADYDRLALRAQERSRNSPERPEQPDRHDV